MIDLRINKEGLANNIAKARENNIIIPTFAQMQNPELVPEKIKEKLTKTGLWDFDPFNLFRVTWKNEAKETGGLYTGINKNTNFVKPFLNWCIDENRKVGDTELVKSTYGYHVMYFVESELGWVLYCRDGIQAEKTEAHLVKLQEANPIEVNYKNISVVATPLT